MTTETSASGDAPVDQRLQALEAQLANLETALGSVKRTRRIIIVLFLAFIVLVGFLLKGIADDFTSEQYKEELIAAAEKQLQLNSKEYMKEVQILADEVTPVVTKAFYEQVKKDTPLYAGAFDREKEILAQNLRTRIENQVNDYYDEALDKYEEEIVRNFPKARDENVRRRLKANLRRSLNELVKKFYADELERELTALYEVWETFPPADLPEEGELPLEDQLPGYLLEVVTIKLSGHGTNILDVGEEAAAADARTGQPSSPPAPGTDPEPEKKKETEAPDKEKPADLDGEKPAVEKPAEKPVATPKTPNK